MSIAARRAGEGGVAALAAAALIAAACRAGPDRPVTPGAVCGPIAPRPEGEPARAEFEKAADTDPLEEGISRLRMGLSDDSIQLIELSLEHNPCNVRALYFLGLAHAYDYRFREARSVWERALTITRDRLLHARIETTVGLTYEIEGRCGEAVEHFQSALVLVPNYPVARDELSALRRRGPIQSFSGNWTEAFALFLFADIAQ